MPSKCLAYLFLSPLSEGITMASIDRPIPQKSHLQGLGAQGGLQRLTMNAGQAVNPITRV